jgi:soluble lytic murein transglycosylase
VAALTLALTRAPMAQRRDLTQAEAARLYIASGKLAPPGLAPAPAIPPEQIGAAARRLRSIATSSGNEAARALAALALGLGEGERGEEVQAKADLTLAARWEPARDAATAALVDIEAEADDAAGALEAAAAYPIAVSDPFYPRIAAAAAKAAAESRDWPEALRWTAHLARTPANLALRAEAEAGTEDTRAAALALRLLVYEFPASVQANQARAQWRRYEKAMPALRPDWRLQERAARAWSIAGRPREAAAAWAKAARMAPARDRAALECIEARAWLAAGETGKAKALAVRLARSSQRAQALELEVELGRRQHTLTALAEPLRALARDFPRSGWYARALHEAGDQAVLENDSNGIFQAFDRLAARFPESVYAPEARWRAAWTAYRLGRADAGRRMEAYVRRYPRGEDVADALFWLGTWLRRRGEASAGTQCLRVAAQRFPGTYFGLEAQRALREAGEQAVAATAAPIWLRPVIESRPRARVVTALAPAARARLAQAQPLLAAGLLDPSATLMEAALREQQPGHGALTLARQVARLEDERGHWYAGLRAMLRAVPDYLDLQPAALPQADWRLLYPLAYRRDVAAACRTYGLDRNLVLAVMRQESGFDAGSLSGAWARGLMQLELGTARREFGALPAAWRRLADPGKLRAADLWNPGLSIALGAADLKRETGEFRTLAEALAAYNAGKSRVQGWRRAYPREEGDAFIETIPFTQTREYVEAVLRNQAAYRRIYGP